MRRIVFIVLLALAAASLLALPAHNPWTLGTWEFDVEGDIYRFRFDAHEKCQDLDTGNEYWYDYDSIRDILIIYDFQGEDWRLSVSFNEEDTECECFDLSRDEAVIARQVRVF